MSNPTFGEIAEGIDKGVFPSDPALFGAWLILLLEFDIKEEHDMIETIAYINNITASFLMDLSETSPSTRH